MHPANARNQNWIYLKFHLHRPAWLMGIGSRNDWHRLWRIKDLTNLPSVGRGTTTSTWLILTRLWKHINPVLISCIRMSWDVQVPFLSEMSSEVFRCLVCRRLVFFRLAGPFRTRCPGGPTVSIAFWSKFSPVLEDSLKQPCLCWNREQRPYNARL
jgi:hypothetical protein